MATFVKVVTPCNDYNTVAVDKTCVWQFFYFLIEFTFIESGKGKKCFNLTENIFKDDRQTDSINESLKISSNNVKVTKKNWHKKKKWQTK